MKKDMIMLSSLFLCSLLSCSCSIAKTKQTLQGKILVSPSQNDTCFYYENSDTIKLSFKQRNDTSISYGAMTWLNTEDAFIGMEDNSSDFVMDRRINIVKFDLLGKITDRLYEAERGEITLPMYPSRDDKYLIFTSAKMSDPKIHPLENLDPMVSLGIMDLEQKKVIIKIDSFGRSLSLKIKESPWLQDGYRFVYSMDGATQFILEGTAQPINQLKTKTGVYIFDVSTGKSTLLIPGGFSAIASPTNNSIAYEKDNCIIVKDLNNNKEKTIYKYKSNEVILTKHWTPDGKTIYLSYLSRSSIADVFNSSGEKLIDVNSGKELSFKPVGWMTDGSYTWK